MDRPTRVVANALSLTPQITQLAYNDQAMIRTITNAMGFVTTFQMDAGDRVTRIPTPTAPSCNTNTTWPASW